MLKTVKKIQERVITLIENDTPHKNIQDISWRTKM